MHGGNIHCDCAKRCIAVVALALTSVWSLYGWGQSREQKSPGTNGGEIARGKYIVEGVAMCGQCHTPRDSSGAPDRGKWLQGAALWLLPAKPTQDWPLNAPRIAGDPAGTDEDLIRLLTTGVWKEGERLRPPMPQFRMSHEDAQGVVAYLKSLNTAPQ